MVGNGAEMKKERSGKRMRKREHMEEEGSRGGRKGWGS